MDQDFLKGQQPMTPGLDAALTALPARPAPEVKVDGPASMDPTAVKVGKWVIPPMSIKTAMLLERIESPFVVATIDPETGKPVPTLPRITDVAKALYVIVNQHDPRLGIILDDKAAFERVVMDMASGIGFREMVDISAAIQRTMGAVDTASQAAGLKDSAEKNAGGGNGS